MAEAILYTLAAELLKSLGSQAVQAVVSAWGFESELRRLEATTNTIKHVLLDAEEKQVEDPLVKHWLKRLKAVMYEVEDLLEEFVAISASWKGKGFAAKVKLFLSCSGKANQARGISSRITEIRIKLDDIESDRQRYNFRERSNDAPNLMKSRREDDTDSFIDEKEVIGRDDDKKIIMDMLFAPNVEQQKASVICIVGMGGLGKTALAKLIFNDAMVREQFDMMLWVCVAEEFGLKTIIQRVLKSAAPDEPCNDLEMDQLRCRLQEKIQGKRCLLVLDDVWNEEPDEWHKVRSRLGPCGDGSKILVTTRLWEVAYIMVDGFPPHKLGGLSPEKSWSLFEKLAFKRGQEQNARLVELGKDIVKKCRGVPLAIRALGSYLYTRDEGKWLSVRDKELSQIDGAVAHTMEVLKLSYRHLRSELKQCFSYCYLFPKDTKMVKETLIRLWMAQGFILSSDDQSLEETGEEYFTELVQRCFFQDIERDERGNILYCKMHDLMHDLAQQVSEGEIVSAIKGRTSLEEGVSHVSFDFFFTVPSEIPTSFLVMSLRTLIFHASTSYQKRTGRVFSVLLSSLKSLRVLELNEARIRWVPRSIGKLVHLRYLCLSDCSIQTLPNSLGNLINLQTLKLAGSSVEVLPSVIERLTSLRHLDLSRSYDLFRMAADISNLTNLRHLDLHSCHSLTHVAADISSLTNLELLDLTGCHNMEQMPSGTGKLTKLRTLPWFIVGMSNVSSLSPESHCGPFTDLKDLNGLRGELCIRILGRLGVEQRQSDAANLRRKAGLLKLQVVLDYDIGNFEDDHEAIMEGDCEDDEAIMEGLQPHPDLKELVIQNYGGLRLPSNMNQLIFSLRTLGGASISHHLRSLLLSGTYP